VAECGASNRTDERASIPVVYAIVRAGGRQEKVSVGDVLIVDRLAGDPGSTVELQPLLLVDGEAVTSSADALAAAKVTAEVVEAAKGPKIRILKFKNKTGYRKRQGHRAKLTRIKVTGITK
jgi:large subunit ribosomal protein L21